MKKRLSPALAGSLLALAFTGWIFGQSSGSEITGVVRDSSGAALPKVEVEATSPALIEGSRRVVTNGNGEYRIVDLRPGTYTVTYTAQGFRLTKREGITLTANFTATVNADLQVGQLSQEVTVVGEVPLVDVQQSVSQQVMDRTKLDLIPTGRDPFAVGQLVAGVTTATPDVGGTGGMQQPTLQVHGSSGNDNVFVIDGMQIQHVAFSGNQTGFYFNDGLMQEIGYQTSTLSAESPVGGVQINMVPREGGNEFHGSFFGTYANNSLESDNLTSKLKTLGLKAQNKVDNIGDYNASFGGPMLKNRLWFFSTFRRWYSNNFLANTFTPAGVQALDDSHLTDLTLRLTYQLNKSNKLSLSYDRAFKFRGHRFNNFISASFSDPIADVLQTNWLNYMLQAKWTYVASSKLLFEAGYSRMPVNYNLAFEPGANPSAIAVYDTSKSTISNISPRQDFDTGVMSTWIGNASYFTGAHNLKGGIQYRTGFFQESFRINGDMTLITVNGVPSSVRLYNTPLAHREELKPDMGLFLQDSWRLSRRLTLNVGIRFDRMVMNIPAQGAPGGMWVPARQYAAQNGIVAWNTWSPRIGIAYDPFGDGKTVIKGGISKYDRLEGTTLAQNVNPNFISTNTCPWTLATPPTSLSQLTGCTGFTGNSNHIDPKMKRPYQWEYTAMIQRQVAHNTWVSAGYYGRKFFNLYGILNTLVPASAYTPVTITNPITGQPLTVYNQLASTRGQFNNVQQTLPNLYAHYNGVEFQVNSRFTKASFFGGFTYGRDFGTPDGTSTDLNNPNNLTNLAGEIGFDSTYQVRAGASYFLPWGFVLAGSVRENSGLPQARTYNVTQAVLPGLTQVTQAVRVAASGDYRYPWQNLVDVRLSKKFRFRERFEVEPLLDVFNLFNSSAVTSAVTTIGPSLLTPSQIDFGRLIRIGGRVNF